MSRVPFDLIERLKGTHCLQGKGSGSMGITGVVTYFCVTSQRIRQLGEITWLGIVELCIYIHIILHLLAHRQEPEKPGRKEGV